VSPAALRFLLLMLLLAALIAIAGWPSRTIAQGARSASPSRVAAERASVDLRQGMTPEEVQALLGKPWRTALSGNVGAGNGVGGQTLRWTYAWSGAPSTASMERLLNVDFTAKTEERWSVNGWNWSAY
jgi:hypothetical protein